MVPPVPTPATKIVDLAVGIVPDLGTGRFKMRPGVRGVHELPGDEAVRNLLCQLVRLGDGALHALRALGEHQLRAVGLHQLAALDAHGLRHDDDDAVAARGGDGGKTDAGVAGGRLNDDGASGVSSPFGLRVVEHRLRNAVLHSVRRGSEYSSFARMLGVQVRCFSSIWRELQQRRVADQLVGGGIDLGHFLFAPS